MDTIDKAVGARIRAYRKALGMSQTDLAERIGVRFQQVQKYENGTNRVAASRLWIIADTLGIPVSALFKDVRPEQTAADECARLYGALSGPQQAQALAFIRALAQGEHALPRNRTVTGEP